RGRLGAQDADPAPLWQRAGMRGEWLEAQAGPMKTIEGTSSGFCCAAGLAQAKGSVESAGRVFALKGRNNKAQGLGPGMKDRQHAVRPESAEQGTTGYGCIVPPFQGGFGRVGRPFPRAEALG